MAKRKVAKAKAKLKAKSKPGDNKVAFEFVSASNLQSPNDTSGGNMINNRHVQDPG